MNNEIGRKITSLTLMTIMLAGGMAVAFPGVTPVQAANANLYVSTNTFGGPMIVEVMINDPNYKDDPEESMPSVTFDGNDLVMAQGSDGNWYAYVADTNMVKVADGADIGMEFGDIVTNTDDIFDGNQEFDDSATVYSVNLADKEPSVLTGTKSLTNAVKNGLGQIKLLPNAWPFIQTFVFTDDSTIKVVYETTPDQTEIIQYDEDMDDFASFSTDRVIYPHNANIHLVIDDMQLNIDPTDEDSWTFNVTNETSYYRGSSQPIDGDIQNKLNYGDNGFLSIDADKVILFQNNTDNHPEGILIETNYVTVTEISTNDGLFENTDAANIANLITSNDNIRGISDVIEYNDDDQSILLRYFGGLVEMDRKAINYDWSSGEELTVTITDQDENENTKIKDDFDVSDPRFEAIPAIKIGNPITIDENAIITVGNVTLDTDDIFVDSFGDRIIITPNQTATVNQIVLEYSDTTIGDLEKFFGKGIDNTHIYSFINYNLESLDVDNVKIYINSTDSENLIETGDDGYDYLNNTSILDILEPLDSKDNLKIVITFDDKVFNEQYALVMDFVRYAGEDGRINDAIYRLEAEETTVSSGVFTGTVEYIMLNQINIFDKRLFTGLTTIGDSIEIIVHEDLTDEDAVEILYLDADSQGVFTQVSAQTEAPTHSAKVFFDQTSYKVADTVTVTIDDADLNSDGSLIDVYTVIKQYDDIRHENGDDKSLLFDVTFNDVKWEACTVVTEDEDGVDITQSEDGLASSMSSITETSADSGVFVGTFQIPTKYCQPVNTDRDGTVTKYKIESVTGTDIELNYQDFRDASGEVIEVGDSAGISANTGSIKLDRTVYPVPYGVPLEANSNENAPSYFAIHSAGISDNGYSDTDNYLPSGDLTIHLRITDPDYDISASGEDRIAESAEHGPVKVMISRGASTVLIGTAGASHANDGIITLGDSIIDTRDNQGYTTKEYGPIYEIAPDAGIFEQDITIRYTDGPASSTCPRSLDDSLRHIEDAIKENEDRHCILQGDILTVQYTDLTDASGSINTVTDSATFDLRNGVLQTDKSVYIIGSDMILTLIEPDFDLDNDQAETVNLDIIEWDSDAATISMGKAGGERTAFDPEPSNFRETGDSTGIFQIVIEIPEKLDGDRLERGEEIELEYTDWGPSGADYVGDEDEDVNVTLFTSNFGATVELDQKVYSWTDKIYITIVAPDHNFDSHLVDEIGNSNSDPIKVATRGHDLDNYKLVETGTDTGIFTGEVILTGFLHNADGDTTTGERGIDTNPRTTGFGPTGGFLQADDNDGLTISFEFSEDEVVVGSSLIRWNIGEVQWLEASYPASGTGVVRIIDPDMNLDPEAVDNFDADVWSDSDAGGIDLTVTETNEATGIFEGTVFFTVTSESSGHRLRVSEGDTVTAEYEDNTLPNPYTTSDELDITATTLIGTIVPPLERAPAANLRTVDAFGNSLDTISVDQQVQITADLSNGQDREQRFAYLVQIQDGTGVTVSLAWITGSLSSSQSFSPALSWIPEYSGSFTATAFVWESVDNPTALSPPISVTIRVS